MPNTANGPAKTNRAATLVHTVHDPLGTVAQFYHFSAERVIYVRWCGHVTCDEVIRVAEEGLRVNRQFQPLGLLSDARGTGGDWGDADPWLTHAWIPAMKAKSLRVYAFVLDPDTPVPYANAQVFAQLGKEFDFRTFFAVAPAWHWLRQRASPLLALPEGQGSERAIKFAGQG